MTQQARFRPVTGLQLLLAIVSAILAVASACATQLSLATRPLYAGGNVPPMVMIDLSKDHTLHQKAYNDYTDLNGDGVLDTTYNNSIDYAGYFDSYKCYTYDGSTQHAFVPSAVTTDKYCNGSAWSGNFLNWASMSRIDEVRKILYGGFRSTDTATTTVLERAFLPMDAHAWAKFYNGSDVSKLVPLTVEAAGPTLTSSTTVTVAANVITGIKLSSVANISIGDQLVMAANSPAPANTTLTGWVMSVDTSSNKTISLAVYPDGVSKPGGAANSYNSWAVTNLTRGGLTICNVTPKDSSNVNSQSNTQAPQLRVVSGNYATWGASEKWQCNWSEEQNNTQSSFLTKINGTSVTGSSNGNRAALSGINASAENPVKAARALGTGESSGTFNARVQVCVPGLLGTENCKQYGSSSYKPFGLLQKYGESGQMLFGLMTGTYDKNISGGVLRQNVVNFSQEVDPTNGTFTYAANSPVKGIVWNVNKLRPYGYSYSDGSYVNADSCNYQQTSIVPNNGSSSQNQPANEGNCSTWGNPISEIYLESLRYFAGKTANSSFAPKGSNSKDAALSLTTPTWANPMDLPSTNANKAPYCTPLNTLVFNSSVSSYDNDQLAGFTDLNTADANSTWTDKVGAGESINGGSWFMGGVNGGLIDNLCSGKTISKLSDVLGICPEGPSQKGTFQIAGAALYAHMNRIRSTSQAATLGVPTADTTSLKVTTYAVQLATNTPKINVNVGSKTVTIMPAYQLHPQSPNSVTADASTGTLVDFKVISQTATSGKFYVNWEDSVAGGDYDQDVWGILSYTVTGNTVQVSTQVVSGSSANGQGFGYVISGTTKDGPHFHSGIYNFKYTDPAPVTVTPSSAPINTSGGCNLCNFGDPQTTVSYTASGSVASQFMDPLYYAAKWGGFKDLNGSGTPDQVSEWDVRLSDGSGGSDGLPDNYFYATNPGALSSALERAFLSILQTSSAASVATSSSSLTTGSTIYQARFNGTDWSGQLLAYAVDTNGVVNNPALWDAGAKMKTVNATARNILTYDGTSSANAGIPFRWGNLPASYQSTLNRSDTLGSARLNWIRGDQSNEGTATGKFRVRPNSVLGDIVNSSPQYVGRPNAGYADADYATFVLGKKSRKPMLYVGANDGMLHAFSANPITSGSDAGTELFAYVPSALYANLPGLSDLAYTHAYYVDGTPAVTDAKVNGSWKTVLLGGLGGGGAGIYALDVTNPESISEGTAASTVLWEFTNNVDADLGYTFGQPSIIKMANGKWAAIFGNGYNSAAGKAYLYVVFLDRPAGSKSWVLGTDYLKLATGAGSVSTPNGLSQPFPADVDGDGTTDFIYAGDLLGNLWKFNMKSTAASAWGLQTANTPLFIATDASGARQPITSSVDVTRNPAGGYVVLFGTGRYVDTTDPANMSTQTFYGIWDQNLPTLSTVARSSLVAQTINREVDANGYTYRMVSQNQVLYAANGKQGWYLDLVSPASGIQGERVVYSPLARGDRIIFTTLIPSANSCDSGGTSWLMELASLSGGRLTVTPFDVNNDRTFSSADFLNDGANGNVPVGGRKSTVGITPAPTVTKCGTSKECKFMTGTTGNQETVGESASSQTGRLSWREILH